MEDRLQRQETTLRERSVVLMAAARSSAARVSSGARRPAPAARPRAVPGGGAPKVRWDRVGRVGLLAVAVVVVILYIGPAVGLMESMRESGRRDQQLQQLQREHQRLIRQRNTLNNPVTLEREARRLGKVLPGERPYVIDGLPAD